MSEAHVRKVVPHPSYDPTDPNHIHDIGYLQAGFC